MLRKLRNIIFSLMALLIILVASITTIVETPAASRWLMTFVANTAGVQLGQVSGNLRNGMDVEFFEYASANGTDAYYRAENISFRWSPAALSRSGPKRWVRISLPVRRQARHVGHPLRRPSCPCPSHRALWARLLSWHLLRHRRLRQARRQQVYHRPWKALCLRP